MIAYKVYLEGNNIGCMAHILSLPGCFAYGRTETLALKNLRRAVRVHLRWLRQNKLINILPKKFTLQIAERQVGSPPWISGSTAALFLPDLIPPTKADIIYYIKLLRVSRSELLLLVRNLRDETVDHKIGKRWTIRRNLDHIANAEWWYLSRIGVWSELFSVAQKAPRNKVLERMMRIRGLAYRIFPRLADSRYHRIFIPERYCDPKLREPWTARKVLRRFIEHEREHFSNIRKMLKEIGT